MTHFCTRCLRSGVKHPIEGPFKQCDACRWKQRKYQRTSPVAKAATQRWKDENREKVRAGNRRWYRRKKESENAGRQA